MIATKLKGCLEEFRHAQHRELKVQISSAFARVCGGARAAAAAAAVGGTLQMGDRSVVDAQDDMAAASKIDGADAPVAEGTPTSSVESTPEHEMQDASSEQPSQPQKRKGGRKPVSSVKF
ncbi:hypothetical protein KC365_g18581 [Hortaea werneckii]|nr:hypothetical protein KC365_g18581 [Hortaea werneckii]